MSIQIKKSELRQIIKEEISKLNEDSDYRDYIKTVFDYNNDENTIELTPLVKYNNKEIVSALEYKNGNVENPMLAIDFIGTHDNNRYLFTFDYKNEKSRIIQNNNINYNTVISKILDNTNYNNKKIKIPITIDKWIAHLDNEPIINVSANGYIIADYTKLHNGFPSTTLFLNDINNITKKILNDVIDENQDITDEFEGFDPRYDAWRIQD